MNKCEKCGKIVHEPLRRIPLKRGKQTIFLKVCKNCFDKEV